jgi:hypothetical protein
MLPTRTSRHHGQALPLALVLLVAVAAIVFFMFNSGQLVQEKIRLTNTADAVAYSAGVLEARVLNYDAYTNRAMVANEIAIGQAVGLASWSKYAGVAATNIAPYLNAIPVVGPAVSQYVSKIEPYADDFTQALAYAIPVYDAVTLALSESQLAVHGPWDITALNSRNEVMRKVAQENDPAVVVDPVLLGDNFKGFTQRYTSQDERKRLGQVVSDSRDAFMQSRNWDVDAPVVLRIAGCKVTPSLNKRGGTELIGLTEGWKSMDTLSLHTFGIRWTWRGPRCTHSETPIGYATALTDDNLDDNGYTYAGSRNTNPDASNQANNKVAEGFAPSGMKNNGVIPEFQELSSAVLEDDERKSDPRTSLTIRVTKPSSQQRFSGGNSIVQPSGRLDLYAGQHAHAESAAIARVEVYFERPDGNNPLANRAEYGSLFNPYWQVRLAPVSATLRGFAQALQGLVMP